MKAYTCEVDDPNLGFGMEVFLPDDLDASFLPVSAARVSFGKEDKTGLDYKADKKLMKFLADNRHVSVFEHNYATFLVECPLFVRSQIIRHRSFTFNEISRRYTSEDIEFWKPTEWRKQSSSNKQASDGPADSDWVIRFCAASDDDGLIPDYETYFVDGTRAEVYRASHKMLRSIYSGLLTSGVCREQARAILPESLLTKFYMTGNMRSWWSFLSSRLKEDTQYETRVVAEKIKEQLTGLWPDAMNTLLGDS